MWQDFYKISSRSSGLYDKSGAKSKTESKPSKIKQSNKKTKYKEQKTNSENIKKLDSLPHKN